MQRRVGWLWGLSPVDNRVISSAWIGKGSNPWRGWRGTDCIDYSDGNLTKTDQISDCDIDIVVYDLWQWDGSLVIGTGNLWKYDFIFSRRQLKSWLSLMTSGFKTYCDISRSTFSLVTIVIEQSCQHCGRNNRSGKLAQFRGRCHYVRVSAVVLLVGTEGVGRWSVLNFTSVLTNCQYSTAHL